MVAKIITGKSICGLLNYNERKVSAGKAKEQEESKSLSMR